MKISGRNGSKKKWGGTKMLNYSSEFGKLSEWSGPGSDFGLSVVPYNVKRAISTKDVRSLIHRK